MIRYLKHAYLNFEKYDACVQQHRPQVLYGYSWYLNTVCPQWDALVLNDYDAVWPLPRGNKWGLTYYYVPYGVQQLGIFSKKALAPAQYDAFYRLLHQQVYYADLNLNYAHQLPQPRPLHMEFQLRRNLVLDLKRPYQQIYEGYSTNLRRKLRKLEEQKFTLFEHDGPEVLLKLFAQNKGAQLKLKEPFYHNIKKLMYKMLHQNRGRLFTVYGGPNMLLAGAFMVEVEKRSYFLFSGLNQEGREAQAMAYLLNEYIIQRSERSHLLDFEGSDQEGLARFYRSFGAEEQNYYRLLLNRLPPPLRWLKSA